MGRAESKSTSGKLRRSVVAVVVLAVCLIITSVALALSMANVGNNLFRTGGIELNLNDGKPVIQENEFIFEPGITVQKEFFLENNGTWSVWYQLYFDNVEGALADVLDITIQDKGGNILYEGTANGLQKEYAPVAEDSLAAGQRKCFYITFHYPENAGNDTQNHVLMFDMCADAVQTKNNPDKVFE